MSQLLQAGDTRVVLVALEGIENILISGRRSSEEKLTEYKQALENCGGIDFIEQLQSHNSQEVYNKAARILESIGAEEEEEEEAAADAQPQQSFNFGF